MHRPPCASSEGLGLKLVLGPVPQEQLNMHDILKIGGSQRTPQQHRLECADAPF